MPTASSTATRRVRAILPTEGEPAVAGKEQPTPAPPLSTSSHSCAGNVCHVLRGILLRFYSVDLSEHTKHKAHQGYPTLLGDQRSATDTLPTLASTQGHAARGLPSQTRGCCRPHSTGVLSSGREWAPAQPRQGPLGPGLSVQRPQRCLWDSALLLPPCC